MSETQVDPRRASDYATRRSSASAPEGDPIRAWLHAPRQVVGDNPLPGPICINVGITRRGAVALENSLRRDVVRTEAVDRLGTPTRRIVLDGVMFEWLAPAAGKRSDTPSARVGGDPRFSVEVWSDDGNRILEELARARNPSVAMAAYDEALLIRPRAYLMPARLCARHRQAAATDIGPTLQGMACMPRPD